MASGVTAKRRVRLRADASRAATNGRPAAAMAIAGLDRSPREPSVSCGRAPRERSESSENELIAERADGEVQPRQPGALALDLGLEARLDVVEKHRELLRSARACCSSRAERLRRVVAARASRACCSWLGKLTSMSSALSFGVALRTSQRRSVGPVSPLYARRCRFASRSTMKAQRLDRVAHGDGAHLVAGDRRRDFSGLSSR